MQHQTQIIVSGLSLEEGQDYCKKCSATGTDWVFTDADEVLRSAQESADGPLIFWLYRAPWSLRPSAPAAEEWLTLHRRLLRQRAAFGQRLVLINADAERIETILSSLGLSVEGAEPLTQVALPSVDADLHALMAKAFEWAAPEYWDVLEALEYAAPPTGRTPMFRNAVQAPVAEQVPVLQRLVISGQLAPVLSADLLAVRQTAHQLQVQLKASADENSKLMLQLHQVQEESEKTYFDSRQQAELAEKSRVEQAELIASLEAESERQAARLVVDGQALATARVQGKELADELKARDSALETSQDAVAQAQVELNARDEALRLAHEAQQQLMQDFASLKAESERQAEQLVADGQALETAQVQGKELADELKARDAALEKSQDAMAQAQVELNARDEALRLAHEAQQQLMQDFASLKAESEEQAEQLVTGAEALVKAQAYGRNRANDLKARDSSLKQSEGELALAQVELGARAEALMQAQAAQQQLTQQLKAESEALAEAQQLTKKGATQISELEGENELLLLQLHQTQEELEQVFLDKRSQETAAGKKQSELEGRIVTLQAEVKVQSEKFDKATMALADVQSQGKKVANDLKARDLALKQSQEALTKAQTELASSADLVKNGLAAQKQLAQDLKLKNAALDAAKAQHIDDTAAIAKFAGAEKQVSTELAAVQEHAKKQTNDLKALELALKQSKDALAKARQLSDKVLVQVSEKKNENELLLLQLHQVQEEMEKYFLENRQLQQVMGQSSGSLDRARRLISRLMLPVRTSEDAS